jgi:RNA recognition motif-containing protein
MRPPLLFIGNLSPKTTNQDLTDLFSAYGKVLSCKVPVTPRTQRPKQVGYIQYEKGESVNRALEGLHGSLLHGRPLRVTIARAMEHRLPREDPPLRHPPAQLQPEPRPPSTSADNEDDSAPPPAREPPPFREPPYRDGMFRDGPFREAPPYRDNVYYDRPLYRPRAETDELLRMLVHAADERARRDRILQDAVRRELDRREAESGRYPEGKILDLLRQLK